MPVRAITVLLELRALQSIATQPPFSVTMGGTVPSNMLPTCYEVWPSPSVREMYPVMARGPPTSWNSVARLLRDPVVNRRKVIWGCDLSPVVLYTQEGRKMQPLRQNGDSPKKVKDLPAHGQGVRMTTSSFLPRLTLACQNQRRATPTRRPYHEGKDRRPRKLNRHQWAPPCN